MLPPIPRRVDDENELERGGRCRSVAIPGGGYSETGPAGKSEGWHPGGVKLLQRRQEARCGNLNCAAREARTASMADSRVI